MPTSTTEEADPEGVSCSGSCAQAEEAEPTPGPWDFSPQTGAEGHCYQAQVWGPDGDEVAAVTTTAPRFNATANARLMAAAPDLLEAAKKMRSRLKYADPYVVPDDAMEDLKAAIAKAEGEA